MGAWLRECSEPSWRNDPYDKDNGVSMIEMKTLWKIATAMLDQGRLGIGRGLRRPAGEWWDALLCAHTHTHTTQATTNSPMFLGSLLGHQKCWRRNRKYTGLQGGSWTWVMGLTLIPGIRPGLVFPFCKRGGRRGCSHLSSGGATSRPGRSLVFWLSAGKRGLSKWEKDPGYPPAIVASLR